MKLLAIGNSLAENPLTLHLLLERLEGLVYIVVANENLHAGSFVDEESNFGQKPR